MNKFSLLFIAIVFSLNGNAQKIKKGKFELSYQLYPLINLPDSNQNYSSNEMFLKLRGKDRVEKGGYNILGEVYPMYKLKEDWGKPHSSQKLTNVPNITICQPFKVVVTNPERDSIYYRIFNYVEEIPETKYFRTVDESSKMDKFGKITDQLDLFFSKRKTLIKLKLYRIDKSDKYDDLNKAYQLCVDGITANENLDIEKRNALFLEAIDIFESALDEAELDNKKARINKDIAEAITRNLVQVLPFVDRVNRTLDLNEELLDTYRGMGNALVANKANAIIQAKKYNKFAKESGGRLTFSELELNKEIEPIMDGDLLFKPKGIDELKNMLVGSWRFFYESYYFPKDLEKEKLERKYDSSCKAERILHFDSRSNFLEQEGSWELNCEQNFEDVFSKWKVVKNKENGDMYIALAFDEEDLEDPMEYLQVLHVSQNLLVIRGSMIDGDTTRGTVVQLQRIGLFEKEK